MTWGMTGPDARNQRDFRLFLQEEFERRCKRNPRYSLRAFAQSLSLHHGTLSQVLRGTRPLTAKAQMKIARSLGFGPAEMSNFSIADSFDQKVDNNQY